MGKTNDELRSLFFQDCHTPLRRLGGVLQRKAGGGSAVVGVHAHQAEDAVGDAAPLQEHRLLYTVVIHSLLDSILIRGIIGRPVVGLQQSRQGSGQGTVLLPVVLHRSRKLGTCQHAKRRLCLLSRIQHPGEALPGVVKLVVAEGGRVIAQGAHGPQFGCLGGVEGLNQGADGEVAAIQQQGVGALFSLPVNGSFQAGVAAGFAAVLRRLGQEVGMEVVGKQDRGCICGRRGIRRDHAEGT